MSKNRGPKNSKLISLFVTFAILFVVVFALGVIIGKGLGGPDTENANQVDKAQAPETIEYGVPEIAEDESGEIIVDDQIEVEDKKSDVSDSKSEDKQSTDEIAAETKTPAAKVEKETPTEKPEQKTPEVKKEKPLAEVAVQKPAEKKEAPKDSAMPKIDPNGRYTVQIGAFQNQNEANKLVNSLKSNGYPAFLNHITTPDKKNWYRVRVGTFAIRPDAVTYGDKLKQSEPMVKSVFITTNN